MTWTKQNIFEPSGCISREAFKALLSGELPAEMRLLADQHVQSCPFCGEALEGFQHFSNGMEFSTVLSEADKAFNKIIATHTKKTAQKRIIWLSIATAASILLLIGIFSLLDRQKPMMQLAENTAKDTVTIVEPDRIAYSPMPSSSEKKDVLKKRVQKTKPIKKDSENFDALVTAEDLKAAPAEATATYAMSQSAPVKRVLALKSKSLNDTVENLKIEGDFIKNVVVPTKAELQSFSEEIKDNQMKKATSESSKDKIYAVVDQQPEFPGGVEEMNKFISTHLQYPDIARKAGISGRVFIQFVVEKSGEITNAKIVRGIGGGCDEEALRVIKMMPRWKPGKTNGQNVSAYYNLPIVFSSELMK